MLGTEDAVQPDSGIRDWKKRSPGTRKKSIRPQTSYEGQSQTLHKEHHVRVLASPF
jgi:hypothetical protein